MSTAQIRSLVRKGFSAALVSAVATVLAACAVGPDYRRPDVATPDEFVAADAVPVSRAEVENEFWISFQDPLLTELIEDSLRSNHDVRIALSKLSEARALRGEA